MVTPRTSRLQSNKMAVSVMDDLGQWTDLFVAVAGASAALAGLVTVAISANIREVLRFNNWLPSRAAATTGVLVLILWYRSPGSSNRKALGGSALTRSLLPRSRGCSSRRHHRGLHLANA
jgi:hypothetical protein